MKKSYVYIIQQDSDGPIKIGKADNIDKRIKQMQTGNPFALELAHSFTCLSSKDALNLEHELHDLLSEHKMNASGGSEWFKKRALCNLKKYSQMVASHKKIKGKDISIDLLARLFEFNATHTSNSNPRFIRDKNGKQKRRPLFK